MCILHPTINLATYHPAPHLTRALTPRKLHPKIEPQAQITFYGNKIIRYNWYENYSDTICDYKFRVSLIN